MLDLFEVDSFERLAEGLKDPAYEGFTEDGVSRFHGVLAARLFDREALSADMLLGYDQNIVRHWRAITEKRRHDGRRLFPKYFQYLALLFTEIYLDRYFSDADGLLAELNAVVEEFNNHVAARDRVPRYERDGLNKLAFWMATGSGKTLLMHVHLRQYRHYLKLHGRERELNRVLLLTPNEGLSRQHLLEFAQSGVGAELFDKEGGGLFTGDAIEIIDIHKLRDTSGDKTVAVEAFEGNNLVFVDEGHRGASASESGQWMTKRNQLCERGFSFEYSATFGQAMRAGGSGSLGNDYARCILFDYSYKYFYRDGYGKDYHILNLEDDSQEEVRQLYLTACLLVFYQQRRLYADHRDAFRPYLVENPLWVFVGGSVNAVRTESKRQVSDVVDVLLFLAQFVADRHASVRRIERLLSGSPGLHDHLGREIFGNAFGYLAGLHLDAAALFDDVLRTVFNAPSPAKLHVELLKGADGEIALHLGDNAPFGLINVGDAPKLRTLCDAQPELAVTDLEFAGSLFSGLSSPDSPITLLIGSKKFAEGWNSWRVSTMGLMNVGKSEGSEIIQLFGRGVRLKGYEFCLKRSRYASGLPAPRNLPALETLHIFGIRADYMRQFREYLEDEGLPAGEGSVEIVLPVVSNLGGKRLRMIRLKDGIDFKRQGPKPTLGPPPDQLRQAPLTVDWYPKIRAQHSRGVAAPVDVAQKHEGRLTAQHLAFLDWDALYSALHEYKNERSWHNLNLPRDQIEQILTSGQWYRLFIPTQMLDFTDFGRVRLWQEIATTLLSKYCERYYNHQKSAYELPHLEYRDLTVDDPNFLAEYRLRVQQSEDQIIATLTQLKGDIEAGRLADCEFPGGRAIAFDRHLYQPLLHVRSELVDVKPVPLNDGERDLVLDLRAFHQAHGALFADKDLYLLRNLSRGRGIGFFEAGNFHPDFILWLLVGGRQYVTFIDPHGLLHGSGPADPKIQFSRTIKDLEQRLADPTVTLNSFILAPGLENQLAMWGEDAAWFDAHHVLFRGNGPAQWVGRMLETVMSGPASPMP